LRSDLLKLLCEFKSIHFRHDDVDHGQINGDRRIPLEQM